MAHVKAFGTTLGSWYEEMINNRNKSVVRDMKWTTDGRKIAIVYEDGAVIVGSVDGNRLWGKDLPYQLRFVEWSPDGKLLLFVTMDAEVHIYDADGNKLRSMKLMGQDNNGLGGDAMITAIHWFAPHGSHNSHVFARPGEQLPHTLIIAFENGKMLLSRGEDESSAELIDSELQSIVFARWSTKGTTLAVVGMAKQGQEGRSRKDRDSGNNIVKFFDCFGRPIRSLRIPGDNIREVSWEGGDLRMALAVDSFIYFANVRHQYLWASFLNTIVYAYPKSDRRDHILTFWDLVTQETYAKTVSNLKLVAAAGDYCAIVISEKVNQASLKDPAAEEKSNSNNDDDDKGNNSSNNNSKANRNVLVDVYTVQLRNAIGAVVDTKTVPFAPKYIAMSPFHVALANDRTVFTWQFQASSGAIRSGGVRNSSSALLDDPNDDDTGGIDEPSGRRGGGVGSKRGGADKCRIFDIENVGFSTAQSPETFRVLTDFIPDFITSITISDKYLVVARKNQTIQRFNIPHLTPENVYALRDRDVYKMQLNNTSSRLAVVDGNGLFTILDLDFKVPRANNSRQDDGESSMIEDEKQQDLSMSGRVKDNGNSQYLSDSFGRKLNIDRKDVWDLQWSEDDPEMLVIMEKTKMVVIQHETPEEPVLSSAYLARFRDLEIRVVALDALFQHPDKPSRELVIDFESKLLREVRDLVAHEGLQRGYGDVESHPHPRLWKLIAHAALEDLDFPMAEKAFVRYGDYFGIKFAQQMAQMPDKMKARAEVAVFLQRFDEAEGIYREIDRKDLAISLRKRVGDYARVVQLLQTGGGNDQLAREAWDQIGNYYADRMKWKKAAQYFQLSRNVDALAECFYRTEQFAELEKLAKDLPDEAPLLYSLAKRFESVGMAEEAVTCFLRSGCPPKEAVDCCVKLNHWAKALTLAEKYDFPQVEGLLIKLAMQFVQSNRRLEAIELFRVANKPTEAAILIGDLAETVAQDMANPALAKKLHVLAALEVERHRKRALEQATQQENASLQGGDGTIASATAATLETLMMTSLLEGGNAGNTLANQNQTLQMTLNTLATHNGTAANNAKKVSKAFANAWRGAAAYHYYMLALRQFYAGHVDAAMKTSIKLCEYDDILAPRTIYSLLCLTALKNRFYGVASKAFVKLETLPIVSDEDKEELQTLAVQIFTVNAPQDPAPLMEAYELSLNMGRSFTACTITGRYVFPYCLLSVLAFVQCVLTCGGWTERSRTPPRTCAGTVVTPRWNTRSRTTRRTPRR